MNKNLQLIGYVFLIFTFLISPIFSAPGGGPGGGDTTEDSGGWFSGIGDTIKQVFLAPARGIIAGYNYNVDWYLELISPFTDGLGGEPADLSALDSKLSAEKSEIENLMSYFQFIANVGLSIFIVLTFLILAYARDEQMLHKAKHMMYVLVMNFALFVFGPLLVEFAIAGNLSILFGDQWKAIGGLYLTTYMLIFYGLMLWLNYILITSIFIGANEQKYYEAKAQRMAFFRACFAVLISGLISVVVMKLILMFNTMFASSGIVISASSDQMGWGSVFTGVILGVILYILSLILLLIGYIVGIIMNIGFLLISVTYVLKKTYGPAQTIGSYLYFASIWMMMIPLAFALPGFLISMIFGDADAGLTSQMIRALMSLLLGVIAVIVYVKMAGRMYLLMRFKKALSVASELKKATVDSVSAMRNAGSTALSGVSTVGGAALGVGAATGYYATHSGQIMPDIKSGVSSSYDGLKSSVGGGLSNVASSVSNNIKSTADTIATNYKYKNFSGLTSKQDAKVFGKLESMGISNLVNERTPFSKPEKLSSNSQKIDKVAKGRKGR